MSYKSLHAKRNLTGKQGLKMDIFMVLFTSIFFLINFYPLSRINSLLGTSWPVAWWSLAFIVLLWTSFILEKKAPSLASRVLFTMVGTWVGTIFILFVFTLLIDITRLAIPIAPITAATIIIAHGAGLSIIGIINGFLVRVKTHTVKIQGLAKAVRIVQLSDIHLGTIRNGPYLERIVRRVNALRPDIVVITGDLVDGSAPLHSGMVSAIDRVKAPVYMIIGNHETYEGLDKVLPIIAQTKIRVLRNEKVQTHGLVLAGIDYTADHTNAVMALRKLRIDRTRPTVLLYHIPELYAEAAKVGVRLQLSGHTHNGQIWPFSLLVKLVHKYIYGAYDIDGMRLYVSPGTGMCIPPMRLGSRNEITLHVLRPKR